MSVKLRRNMMTKREALVSSLQKNIMSVIFTKKNGEERTMHCTLNETLLPETTWREELDESKKKENLEVLAVWDVDIDAWRSFRLDSIKDLKVIEGVI
jgi:hypothetical protein